MKKKTTRACVIFGIVIWQSCCGSGRQQNCEKHIQEEIRPGLSAENAQVDLQKCGFKTTMDPVKKTLYGSKLAGSGVVLERTQVLVDLDSDKKVLTVRVSSGLVGP